MTPISFALSGLCLAALAAPGISAAPPSVPSADGTPVASPALSAAPAAFAKKTAVSDDILSGARGAADLSLIDQTASVQNSSNVAGNSINGDFTTGVVSIASDAFAGTTGLTMFNINTGNNVAINASMNVNVAIQP